MERIFRKILKFKWTVVAITVVALVFSVVGIFNTNVNSDLAVYLPDDSSSKKTIEILSEKFGVEGEGLLAIEGDLQGFQQTAELVKDLESVDGVGAILWLGTFSDLLEVEEGKIVSGQPIIADEAVQEIVEPYYRYDENGKGYYVMLIALGDVNAAGGASVVMGALEEKIIAYENTYSLDTYIGGTAMMSKQMLDSALGDLPKFIAMAGIAITLILLLTSRSLMSCLIFLISIGISIVFNMGTNFLTPQISTITISVASILQLALSMDYSIFLTHAFEKEKENHSINDAMIIAIKKTGSVIFASAMTTIAGFVALFAMRFELGFDLGLCLAKGVFLSFITVMIIQPCLMIILNKWSEKTTHRYINFKFNKLGAWIPKFKWVALVLVAVLIVPSAVVASQLQYNYIDSGFDDNATGAEFVIQEMGNQSVYIVPKVSDEAQFGFLKQIENDPIIKDNLVAINSYYFLIDTIMSGIDTTVPVDPADMLAQLAMLEQAKSQFFTSIDGVEYTMINIMVKGEAESVEALAVATRMDELIGENFDTEIYSAGNTRLMTDMKDVTEVDFIVVSVLSALLILAILIITFKKFSMSLLLIALIQFAILINLSITTLSGVTINFMSYVIISAIQMGATIDYAILYTKNYQESHKTMLNHDAIADTVNKSSMSITVSMMILVSACMSCYFLSTDPIIKEITMLIARGSFISYFMVLLFLPSIWAIGKNKIAKPPKVKNKNKKTKTPKTPEITNNNHK